MNDVGLVISLVVVISFIMFGILIVDDCTSTNDQRNEVVNSINTGDYEFLKISRSSSNIFGAEYDIDEAYYQKINGIWIQVSIYAPLNLANSTIVTYQGKEWNIQFYE